ncbi:hypothetical protein AJ88_42300 [Mesorhizobium amorphae CCBAU 01583]|nr:hypothetical protein AJ88_42300 [Mesorhizobium amorphae CCBAU 01583]
MVRDVKFHDAAANGVEPLGLRVDHHAFANRRRAGRRRAAAALDLDEETRHEPNESSISVAQSFGISTPPSIAARMIDVPSGTVMLRPSTVSVTCFSAVDCGVPKSISSMSIGKSALMFICQAPIQPPRAPAPA